MNLFYPSATRAGSIGRVTAPAAGRWPKDWARGTSLPEKKGVGRFNLYHTKQKWYKCSEEDSSPIRTPEMARLDIRPGPDVAPRGTHHECSAGQWCRTMD